MAFYRVLSKDSTPQNMSTINRGEHKEEKATPILPKTIPCIVNSSKIHSSTSHITNEC